MFGPQCYSLHTYNLVALHVQVERQFRLAWADHGDDISRQYAGTGALKSGFTRTGRRSAGGLLDDGAKSAVRYLRNNFADGRRQDALDLLTGAYVPSKGTQGCLVNSSRDVTVVPDADVVLGVQTSRRPSSRRLRLRCRLLLRLRRCSGRH